MKQLGILTDLIDRTKKITRNKGSSIKFYVIEFCGRKADVDDF